MKLDNSIDTFLFGALTAVLGGAFGSWAQAQWQEQQAERNRKLAFTEKQVHEFYAPVIGRYRQARSMEVIRTGEIQTFKKKTEQSPSPTADIAEALRWGTGSGRAVKMYVKDNFERQKNFHSEILSILHDRGYLAEDVLSADDRDEFVVLGEFIDWQKSAWSKEGTPDGLAPNMDKLDAVFSKLETEYKKKLKILEN